MKKHDNNASKFGLMVGLAGLFMSMNPGISTQKAKRMARSKPKRINTCNNNPHYGDKAAARNVRHAEAGTHGLCVCGPPLGKGGHIEFAGTALR